MRRLNAITGLSRVLIIAAALAIPAATTALAADTDAPSGDQQITEPTAGMVSSRDAYEANVNPMAVVPTTGPYDWGDNYRDDEGNPLPGWEQTLDYELR